MKVRFLFHKPEGEFRLWPPRVVGTAIVAWTWILGCFYNWKVLKYSYSHEEIWLPERDTFLPYRYFESMRQPYIPCSHKGCLNHLSHPCEVCGRIGGSPYIGRCFSSTTRGDANGVRFAPAAEVLHHPERWDYIECEVDPGRLEVALAEAERLVGAKYDYWAIILGFSQPFPIQDEEKWYCSEICDWFKYLCRIPTERGKVKIKKYDPFKMSADMLHELGILSKRHKRISPRRSAYLLAKVWGEPKSLI